uniref:WASH complex subunit strumpellin n=1 Tax=Elaeophora elaphi TaxID=1147741 RepID=A0A0R3RQD4_9BILA
MKMSNAGNIFGINFLKELIETGHAILAEIFRLADCVPDDFKNPARSRFKPFIVDFSYFDDFSIIDRYLDSHEQGAQLEDEYLFTFERHIKRFGALFDAIAHFFADLIEYSENNRSSHMAFSVRRTAAFLMLCQHEAEALFIAGVILLALDEKYANEVRQRLFVAHYRSNPFSSERFDLLVDVLKAASSREELFKRLPLNKAFVNNMLLILHTDVLFPDENELVPHELSRRGIRASRYQRAFLSVCLFFLPTLLHSDYVVMRHIVDTFFTEEWVVHLHMGIVMNMLDAWDHYKAASNALQHALSAQTIKHLTASHVSALKAISFPHTVKFSVADVIMFADLVAVSNKHLEWVMLHAYKPEKCSKRAGQLYDIVNNQIESCSLDLFNKLLEVSIFEYGYKEIARSLLDNKDRNVRELKEEVCDHVVQVADLFANELPLQRIKKNEKLRSWLLLLKKTIEGLDVLNADASSLISELKNRLDQVSDMHDLSGIVAVSQYLHNTQALLATLSHYCMFDGAFLKKIEATTNFSYGWAITDQWTENMKTLVKVDPLPVRSLFVKMAGSIKLTLGRLHTPERISSISLCYSRLIEAKLRKILQAVPRSLFALLDKVAALLNPPQGRSINKTDVRQFADSDRRLQLAAITHAISMLSIGISTMQLTSLGSLRVDPSNLLLDGIRKELVSQICATLRSQLTSDLLLDEFLTKLKNQFAHLRGAFVYMCEHIAINGAVVWHNELARIIGYMIEKECNAFLQHPITEEESLFQSRSAPIPNMLSFEGSLTPLHRLYIRILNASDPKSSYFVNSMRIWCDLKTKKTVLSNESLNAIQEALSPMALHALDRIASFHIIKYLCTLCEQLSEILCPAMTSVLNDIALMKAVAVAGRLKIFDYALSKFLPNSSRFVIGQLQLLRQQILAVNQLALRQHSSNIFSAVATLNEGVIGDIRGHRGECDATFLGELSTLLERCAITDPFMKIYIRRETPQLLIPTMFLILLTALSKFNVLKKTDSTDVSAFCAGFACILFQFNVLKEFFDLCNIYISAILLTTRGSAKQPTFVHTLRLIAHYSSVPSNEVEEHLLLSLPEKS